MKSVKVKSKKLVGYEDVYNMEVEKHHNFSIEGGLIVHNCVDATRYEEMYYRGGAYEDYEEEQPEEKEEPAPVRRDDERMWQGD